MWLRKALKKDLKRLNPRWVQISFNGYRKFKKGGYERNLLAAVIKKYKEPYHIKGWAENQKKYQEYFKMDGHINSVKDLWKNKTEYVTMWSNNSYYKGDKSYEYHLCGTYLDLPQVMKLGKYNKKRNSFSFESDNFMTVDDKWLTAFRYSTEEEISDYISRAQENLKIEKEIKQLEEKISKLKSQRNAKNTF